MDTVRAVWIHSSPNWIEPGEFVTSAAERGVTPRTFPAGDVDDAVVKGWYDPNRVYILRSEVDPINHIDQFAFVADNAAALAACTRIPAAGALVDQPGGH
jgi:hypothetical protein